jgi:hypothetical protein
VSDERHIIVTVKDEKLTVLYQLKLAEDSVLLQRLIATDAKEHTGDFVGQLVGNVGLLQWKHPGWKPNETYFDVPVLDAPVVHLPPENGMLDISVESEPYDLYVTDFEILLANPESDHLFRNDDLTLNIPGGRAFLDLPHGENFHAIANQDSSISVIDRNQLSDRYPRLTLDTTQQRSVLKSFWAYTHIMVPHVHVALLSLVGGVLPLILLFAFVSRQKELITSRGWVMTQPLLCALLVTAAADVALWTASDLPYGWFGTYALAVTGLLVVWLPAIRGLWRRVDVPATAVGAGSPRRWLWIGAFGLFWCCAATTGVLVWSRSRHFEWVELSDLVRVLGISVVTFFLAAVFVDAALPGFSGRAVALATVAFSSILVAVGGVGDWLLTPETQRLNIPGRSIAVLVSVLLLVGLLGMIIAWVRAVVAETGRKRSRTLEALVLVLLGLATLPWLIRQAVSPQPEFSGAWAIIDLLDGLDGIQAVVTTACVFFIIYKLDELPENRAHLQLKRSTIILYAILTFYWFDDQWLYIPMEIVSGAILLVWFALPCNLENGPAGNLLSMDGLRWPSGLRGAAYGALAGVPWVVLALSSVEKYSWDAAGPYPLLELMGGNFWIVLQWPIYGFFFAYAYPILRGATAISKALTLTIVAIVPLSLSSLFSWHHADLKKLAVFALEMLAFSLLLASLLAVSNRSRNEGFAWRDVPKVYGRSLVTWGAPLAVAIAAAIAGALATGATGLLTTALSQQPHLPSGLLGGP